MKTIVPHSILLALCAACVPSGEFVDFKEGDFSSVESTTTTNSDSLSALEARLSALEEKNTTLESNLSAAQTQIEDLKTENSQLQNDLNNAENNIDNLQTDLSTLTGGGDTSITEQVFENAASIAQILDDQQEAQTQITASETSVCTPEMSDAFAVMLAVLLAIFVALLVVVAVFVAIVAA